MIVTNSEVDFFELYRKLKETRTRKVEKSSKSNLKHNSYTNEDVYVIQKGKNYYGKKRRNYSDYS